MNECIFKFQPEDLERYKAVRPHFLAMAQCFLSSKALRALEYAVREPCHLVLRIVNVPDYPSIEAMEFFSRHSLSVRKWAIKKAYCQNVRNAREMQHLFRDAVNYVAEFGRAGWALYDFEKALIGLLTKKYDEVVDRGNKMFWRNMYDKGAILEPDEVGIDIASLLYDIILGQTELDINNTRSLRLRELLCLDNKDAIVIAKRIITLVENPDSAETREAANIMVRMYLEKKYEVNKGRSREAINKSLGDGVYYWAIQRKNALGEIVDEDVLDPQSQDDFLAVDRYTVYQSALSIITKPEDKAIFELSFKHSMGELSDTEYETEAAKLDTTPGKIEDRLRYFPRKYPLLAFLN